jgi:hypothetical protein
MGPTRKEIMGAQISNLKPEELTFNQMIKREAIMKP